MIKSMRIIAIITIGTVIVWTGFAIRPSSEKVEAKVFDVLQSFAKGMPDYLFGQGQDIEPRKIKVNGIQTFMTVQQSDDEISEILDFYAGQYQPILLDPKMEQTAKTIGKGPFADKTIRIYQLLKCMEGKQQVRHESDGLGFLGAFEFHNKKMKIPSGEFIKIFTEAVDSGQLGKIGTFKVTMALKRDRSSKTQILNFWTSEDLNLNNLRPDALGDMPGEDIENIPRFAGAARRLSVSQENQLTLDRVVVYASEGSTINHILYYHSMMANEGWHADLSFDKAMKGQSGNNIMFYKRKGRECTISIDQDGGNGKIITTIMDRKTKSR